MHTNFNLLRQGSILIGLILTGCAPSEDRFTQMPGFDEILQLQISNVTTARERALLEQYKPILYVAAGEPKPLDFYADYIASGCLRSLATAEEDCEVSQTKLNQVKLLPDATFTHIPTDAPTTAVGYASVYRGTIELEGLEPARRDWLFLRYNFAFRYSGIATGITISQAVVLELFGNLRDWHQLDHYTAVFVALDEQDEPVAVMLQQHNYLHTYLVGTDPAFPRGGPFRVDVAKRSNEYYPHRAQPTGHRAASFMSKNYVDWIAGDGTRPLLGTIDETSGDEQVDYQLKFLPPDDAFYIFQGRLGTERLLPGRDGPPGAIYYTLPSLWRFEDAMAMFYWEQPDEEYIANMQTFSYDFPGPTLIKQRRRIVARMLELGLVR